MLTAETVLTILNQRQPAALFVPELKAVLGARGEDVSALDELLSSLEEEGSVVVVRHSAPDPHLEAMDLRVVAAVPRQAEASAAEGQALQATETVWMEWLRQFLATHRCQ